LNSRTIKILSATGATVLLTAGGVSAAQLDKAVTLSVDGAKGTAHVFGSTVSDLLESEGIAVKPGDVVVPAASTLIEDGDAVTVKYSRLLTLTVDGKTRQIRTTESTVDAALLALGVRSEGARLSVSRSQPIGRQGLAISVTTPKDITVLVGGKSATHTVTAATVSEALAQLRVTVGKSDKVTPAPSSALVDGSKIVVQQVATKDAKKTEAVPFKTVRTVSSSLAKGQTKVTVKGVAGSRVVTIRQTLVDGRVVSTKELSATVTKAPVAQVVLVGTKVATSSSTTSSTTSGSTSGAGLNLARADMWDRVAACESGGNWSINTGNGYYGGLQFSISTWLAYNGGQFASRADLASRAEQITVANRVYADNGLAQWSCKA
jgi:uncharacterized protein YabE (DUF348 family)